MNILHKYKNAKAAIEQIKNGEWIFKYNEIDGSHLNADRNGLELWVGNGGFFCDINNRNAFGLIFRHWVWWAAARKAKQEADSKPEIKLY